MLHSSERKNITELNSEKNTECIGDCRAGYDMSQEKTVNKLEISNKMTEHVKLKGAILP